MPCPIVGRDVAMSPRSITLQSYFMCILSNLFRFGCFRSYLALWTLDSDRHFHQCLQLHPTSLQSRKNSCSTVVLHQSFQALLRLVMWNTTSAGHLRVSAGIGESISCCVPTTKVGSDGSDGTPDLGGTAIFLCLFFLSEAAVVVMVFHCSR